VKHRIPPLAEINFVGIGQYDNPSRTEAMQQEPACISTPLFDWWGWRFQSGIGKKKQDSAVVKSAFLIAQK
jgi:hypothetical protein